MCNYHHRDKSIQSNINFELNCFPICTFDANRKGVYYLSIAAAGFLVLILGLAILRFIVFCIVWVITGSKHHFWLFPNLTEDVGFLASFWPLYTVSMDDNSSTCVPNSYHFIFNKFKFINWSSFQLILILNNVSSTYFSMNIKMVHHQKTRKVNDVRKIKIVMVKKSQMHLYSSRRKSRILKRISLAV